MVHTGPCCIHFLSPFETSCRQSTSFVWGFSKQPFFGLVGEEDPPPINAYCGHHGCHSALGFLFYKSMYSDNFDVWFLWLLNHLRSRHVEGQCTLCDHAVLLVLFIHTFIIYIHRFGSLISYSISFSAWISDFWKNIGGFGFHLWVLVFTKRLQSYLMTSYFFLESWRMFRYSVEQF